MIKIAGTFYLEKDPICFILVDWDGTYQKPDSKGRVYEKRQHEWYYSNFEGLMYGLKTHLYLKKFAECESVDDLMKSIAEVKTIIEKFVEASSPYLCPQASTSLPDTFGL